MNLFIYGTLKRGGSNHALLAGQKFLGPARTAPGYTLYSLGDYPGMVAHPADRDGVTGEAWSVDAHCLAQLDQLEGLNEGLYLRTVVPLQPPFANAEVQTYLYACSLVGCTRLGTNWPV
jgi:gamma-glutamylaminecyclotransferase